MSVAYERLGWVAFWRRALINVCARFFSHGGNPGPIKVAPGAQILVIRLDSRLGNRLLLLPLLKTLHLRFPDAQIDLLAHEKGQELFASLPYLRRYHGFNKRRFLGARGWASQLPALRRAKYDVCIDAGNPTDPSATQALATRCIRARASIGSDTPPYPKLYSHPVNVVAAGPCEVSMRLALCRPLPRDEIAYEAQLPLVEFEPSQAFCDLLSKKPPFDALIFVGARLRDKQLSPEDYCDVAKTMVSANFRPLFIGGLGDAAFVRRLSHTVSGTDFGPELAVVELAALMRQVRCVVSCDTGPMHLAVAVGVPTCGLFVSTDPRRYGPRGVKHLAIDARNLAVGAWRPQLLKFLAQNRRQLP